MKPQSPFLEEPRAQNQYRNEFVRAVGQAPPPEPLTFLADDLHKVSNFAQSSNSKISTGLHRKDDGQEQPRCGEVGVVPVFQEEVVEAAARPIQAPRSVGTLLLDL
jgi:hypothetical protein